MVYKQEQYEQEHEQYQEYDQHGNPIHRDDQEHGMKWHFFEWDYDTFLFSFKRTIFIPHKRFMIKLIRHTNRFMIRNRDRNRSGENIYTNMFGDNKNILGTSWWGSIWPNTIRTPKRWRTRTRCSSTRTRTATVSVILSKYRRISSQAYHVIRFCLRHVTTVSAHLPCLCHK